MKDWLPEDTYEFIREMTPMVCVDIAYVLDSQVLLLKRKDFPMRWATVGGRILRDEPIKKAMERIMLRETGIIFRGEKINMVGAKELIMPIQHVITLVIRIDSKLEKKPKIRIDDTSFAYKWVGVDKVRLRGWYGDILKEALK